MAASASPHAARIPSRRRGGWLGAAVVFMLVLGGCTVDSAPTPTIDPQAVFYRAGLPPSERARVEEGRRLFLREFTEADGLGDGDGAFNGPSCVSCHLYPSVGGSGPPDRMTCMFPDPEQPLSDVSGAALHSLRGDDRLPPCPSGAERRIAPPVYGLGWTLRPELVDRLTATIAARSPSEPSCRLVHGGTPDVRLLGRQPFSPNLRAFVAVALHSELGLTVQTNGQFPDTEHDTDARPDPEITLEQFDAMVAFLTWLDFPPRAEEYPPGEAIFERIGCGSCHTREVVPGVDQQWRNFGVVDMGPHFVPSALRDHSATPGERVVSSLRGFGDKFRRGAAFDSDNSQADLDGSLRNVHQGAALPSAEAYFRLSPADRAELLRFLVTL